MKQVVATVRGGGSPAWTDVWRCASGQEEQLFAPRGQVSVWVSVHGKRMGHPCRKGGEKRHLQGGEAGAVLESAGGRTSTCTLGTSCKLDHPGPYNLLVIGLYNFHFPKCLSSSLNLTLTTLASAELYISAWEAGLED